MMVAYELGKTLEEVTHMPLQELTDWLAFFNIREKNRAAANKPNTVTR